MNLPQLAVRRPVTIFMVYLAIALFGLLAIGDVTPHADNGLDFAIFTQYGPIGPS